VANVPLDFTPPTEPDITKLHIEEATAMIGPFSEIEVVTSIGAYPDYITRYTTTLASSLNNWFRIRWENSKGAYSPYSNPIQGGTTTLVQEIIDRVMLRDPLADENITKQEAEAVIEDVLYVTDPYAVDPTLVTAKQKSGITFLTLARVYLSSIVTSISAGDTSSYTAGLVSQSSGTNSQSQISQGLSNIQQLIEWANRDLGLDYSVVMLLAEIDVAGALWSTGEWTFEALTQ
jgi:hypothetical protein